MEDDDDALDFQVPRFTSGKSLMATEIDFLTFLRLVVQVVGTVECQKTYGKIFPCAQFSAAVGRRNSRRILAAYREFANELSLV